MYKGILRILVVIMCFMIAVTFFPENSFAEPGTNLTENKAWQDINENQKGSICENIGIRNTGDKAFDFSVKVYEDKEHKKLYKSGDFTGEATISIEPAQEDWISLPIHARVDEINEAVDINGKLKVEYILSKVDWEDASNTDFSIGDIISYTTLSIRNYTDKPIRLIMEIYTDDGHKKLMRSESVEFPANYQAPGEGEEPKEIYTGEEKIRLDEIIDNSGDSTEPSITYIFHDTNSEMTSEQIAEVNRLDKILAEKLKKCSGQEYSIKIADPEDLQRKVWATKEEAVEYTLGYENMAAILDIENTFSPGGNSITSLASLNFQYYQDRELKKPVNTENLKPGQTYYLDAYYVCEYKWDNLTVSRKIHVNEPCKVVCSFVDVDPNSPEVKQIKKNDAAISEEEPNITKLNYDDLAWLNIRTYMGMDVPIPNISYADSMLKERDPKCYETLIGDTELNIRMIFGNAGDFAYFSRITEGVMLYYVEDVCYGPAYNNYANISMSNVLYVPKDSKNRAEQAEKRANKYFKKTSGKGNYDIEVEEYTNEALAGHMQEKCGVYLENPEELKAAYLTEYGVAFYNDEKQTGKENFLGMDPSYPLEVFSTGTIEKTEKTLDYVNVEEGAEAAKNNVTVYKPYKLVIKNHIKNTTQEYLYAIAIGTKEQLKEPFANWKDKDTKIITKGENGQIPIDTYSKVRIIGGNELEIIQHSIGNDRDVAAYDINAFTNFSGGKLTDLGGGEMKVMIPLNKFKGNDVKIHYVDDENKSHVISSKIEEYEGTKYITFITNHFSVYAISENSNSTVISEGGTADSTHKPENSAKTGDDSNMILWVGLLVIAVAGATTTVVFGRSKRAK